MMLINYMTLYLNCIVGLVIVYVETDLSKQITSKPCVIIFSVYVCYVWSVTVVLRWRHSVNTLGNSPLLI